MMFLSVAGYSVHDVPVSCREQCPGFSCQLKRTVYMGLFCQLKGTVYMVFLSVK